MQVPQVTSSEIGTRSDDGEARPRGKRLHPVTVRVLHWTNAIGMLIMIGSGWKIYNDEPVFGWLEFPARFTLGGDPDVAYRLHGNAGYSGALLWHFAGMWLVMGAGAAYLVYGSLTGRFRRLVPITLGGVLRQVGDALRFKLSHDDITVYNQVQRLLYVGVIVIVIVQVLSGLAIWKPMQFAWLISLFGDFQGGRLVHFLGMSAIVGFLIIHVTLSLLVPRSLLAMLTGGPRLGGNRRNDPAPPVPGGSVSSETILEPGE